VFILFYVLKVDFIVKSPTQYLNPLIPTVPKCHVSEKRMSHMGKENGPLGGVVGPGGGSGVEGRRKGKGVVTRHVKGKSCRKSIASFRPGARSLISRPRAGLMMLFGRFRCSLCDSSHESPSQPDVF